MIRRLATMTMLWGCFAAGCASSLQDAPVGRAEPVAEWSRNFNNIYCDGEIYFAGRPSTDGIYDAANKGVTVVVDLLTPAEQQGPGTINEKATVERLGMRFVSIPVSPDTFSMNDVDRFAEVLTSTAGPVLVHCSSANRAGGLWAAYLATYRGFDVEDAIGRGRAAGLSRDSMIQAVRRVIEAKADAEAAPETTETAETDAPSG